MYKITKKPEPNELTIYRNGGGKWDDLSLNKGKKALKEQLLEEQEFLCAYCTGRISFKNMKVEHWYPRNPKEVKFKLIGEAKQLEYANLLAVCEGCFNGHESHCDTSKGEHFISIDPQQNAHVMGVFYEKSTGSMCSSNPIHQSDIDIILRLNLDALKKNRKVVLDTLRIGLRNKSKRGKNVNLIKELGKWTSQRKPFGQIAILYLKKKIK